MCIVFIDPCPIFEDFEADRAITRNLNSRRWGAPRSMPSRQAAIDSYLSPVIKIHVPIVQLPRVFDLRNPIHDLLSYRYHYCVCCIFNLFCIFNLLFWECWNKIHVPVKKPKAAVFLMLGSIRRLKLPRDATLLVVKIIKSISNTETIFYESSTQHGVRFWYI